MIPNTARTPSELRARLEQMAGRERLSLWGSASPGLSSGHESLDALLPGGGWPVGALTELLADCCGIGELGLLLPALRALARAGRSLVWIAPPYVPYAPALVQQDVPLSQVLWIRTAEPQEALWATEQALRCPTIGAVLGWSAHITDRSLRRLQLAAETGHTLGVLHRPVTAARESSPAALRLQLQPLTDGGLAVEVKKSRGGRTGARLHLPRSTPRTPDALAVHPSASTAA
jgi:hypothetical protein